MSTGRPVFPQLLTPPSLCLPSTLAISLNNKRGLTNKKDQSPSSDSRTDKPQIGRAS